MNNKKGGSKYIFDCDASVPIEDIKQVWKNNIINILGKNDVTLDDIFQLLYEDLIENPKDIKPLSVEENVVYEHIE